LHIFTSPRNISCQSWPSLSIYTRRSYWVYHIEFCWYWFRDWVLLVLIGGDCCASYYQVSVVLSNYIMFAIIDVVLMWFCRIEERQFWIWFFMWWWRFLNLLIKFLYPFQLVTGSEIFLLLSFLLFDLSGIDHENKNWTMICLSAVVFSILLPFIESLVSILDFCAVQGRHAMDVKWSIMFSWLSYGFIRDWLLDFVA